MKLILAIIRDDDSEQVSSALIDDGLRATRIASTGGFLRRGMTTFVIGVEDEKVEGTIERIGEACSPASEPGMRRATLFILKVDNFIQI
jgi:uncharacterized protein YaaQ